MDYTTYFNKLDKILFPYLYKKPHKMFSMFTVTPFILEEFNADLTEFNRHINDFNKVNSEMQSIIQYNNNVLSGKVPISDGVTGSWEVAKNLPELGKEILSNPEQWLFDVIKNTFILVWNNLFPVLKWLCLIIAVAGVLYMLFCDGQGKKYTAGAVVAYVIFSILNALIN